MEQQMVSKIKYCRNKEVLSWREWYFKSSTINV